MAFSSIPGNVANQPGSITPSYVTSFGYKPFDYTVHQLTAKSIRVAFNKSVVSEDAMVNERYSFSSVSSGSFIPNLILVRAYEPDDMQFELVFDNAFSWNSVYSVVVSGVPDRDRRSWVTGSGHNFTANVKDGPQAISAYLYSPGRVIVSFDRDVGKDDYFSVPTILCLDSQDPNYYAELPVTPWGSQQPKNSVVCDLSPLLPSAQDYVINYSGVCDISGNSIQHDQTIPLSIPQSIPRPISFATLNQIYLTDSYITDTTRNYDDLTKCYSNIDLSFSTEPNLPDVINPLNYVISQPLIHISGDTNTISVPDATDLPSLALLASEFITKFNSHAHSREFHYAPDFLNEIQVVAVNDKNYVSVINNLAVCYFNHKVSDEAHNGGDPCSNFLPSPSDDLPSSCSLLNLVKSDYNLHISRTTVTAPLIDLYIPGSSIEASYSQIGSTDIANSHYLRVSIKVRSLSSKTRFSITLNNIRDSSGFSTISNEPFEPRPVSKPTTICDINSIPDSEIVISIPGHLDVVDLSTLKFTHTEPLKPVLDSSLQNISRVLLELADAFNMHRTSSVPVHAFADQTNEPPNYIPSLPIHNLINFANALRDRYLYHSITASYHYNSPDLSASDLPLASDIDTLKDLVHKLVSQMRSHFGNGFSHGSSRTLTTVNPFNLVRTTTGYMKNNEEITGRISFESYHTNPFTGNGLRVVSSSTVKSIALAKDPCEAAAIPISGLRLLDEKNFMFQDQIVVYFSKRMRNDSDANLGPVTITGPSISILNRSYTTDMKAVLNISNSLPAVYSLSATGVKDLAGNEVL